MRCVIEKIKDFRAIRKRTRESVTQEHIRYNAKILGRMGELVELEYRRVKNQEKWDRVLRDISPMLHETGKILGCRVETSLNEQMLTATILYRGTSFFLDHEEIKSLILPADSITVVEKDGEFWLALKYSLCDLERIADHSEPIEALEFCFKASGGPNAAM